MAQHVAEAAQAPYWTHNPVREAKTRPYVTSPSIARAHTGASSNVRSAHLNIPNEVKLWHKSAPWVITAATILGLIVIFQH
jgi:hypothetical protein